MTGKPLLLLVDDDAAFRHVMAGELARLGLRGRARPRVGEDALAACAKAEPDVVLLDLQLPDMSGLEVLKALRERQPRREVIMLTGHGSIDTAIESIRIGAFDYVSKPCPLDELEIRIQRALERQALPRPRQPAGARPHAARPRQLVRRREPGVSRRAPADRAGRAERTPRCSSPARPAPARRWSRS